MPLPTGPNANPLGHALGTTDWDADAQAIQQQRQADEAAAKAQQPALPVETAEERYSGEHPVWSKLQAGEEGFNSALGGIPNQVIDWATGEGPEEERAYQRLAKVNRVSAGIGEAAGILPVAVATGGIGEAAEGAVLGGEAVASTAGEEALTGGIKAGTEALEKAGLDGMASEAKASISRRLAAKAARYGAEGLAQSVPSSLGAAINGDYDKAAEAMLMGGLSGAVLGGTLGSAGMLTSKAGETASTFLPGITDKTLEALEGEGANEAISKMIGKASNRLVRGGVDASAAAAGHAVGLGAVAGIAADSFGKAAGERAEGFATDMARAWVENNPNVKVATRQLAERALGRAKGFAEVMALHGESVFDQYVSRVPQAVIDLGEQKAVNAGEQKASMPPNVYKHVSDSIKRWETDPQSWQHFVSETLAPISPAHDPGLGMATVMKLNNIRTYLTSQMPKPPQVQAYDGGNQHWTPKPHEQMAFMNKVQAAMNPSLMQKKLVDGTLTRDHMDALRACYPVYAAAIQKAIMQFAQDRKRAPKLTYEQKVRLSKLAGAPLDRTTTNVARTQQNIATTSSMTPDQKQLAPQDNGKPVKVNIDKLPDGQSKSQEVMTGAK